MNRIFVLILMTALPSSCVHSQTESHQEKYVCSALCKYTTSAGAIHRIDLTTVDLKRDLAWQNLERSCKEITCTTCPSELQRANSPELIEGQKEYSLRAAGRDLDCVLALFPAATPAAGL